MEYFNVFFILVRGSIISDEKIGSRVLIYRHQSIKIIIIFDYRCPVRNGVARKTVGECVGGDGYNKYRFEK